MSLLNNLSNGQNIQFRPTIEISLAPWGGIDISTGDFDSDGKPDIITISSNTSSIKIFRNRIGEETIVALCPPMSSTQISSTITGSTYQWQEDSGNGYINLTNNTTFSGVNTSTLNLANIASSWTGRKYRCLVNGNPDEAFEIRFTDQWLGTQNNLWSNPANWSCGVVPDAYTDVKITSGDILINSNTAIRSLELQPGVKIYISNGTRFDISH